MQSLRVSFQTRSMGFQIRAVRGQVIELKLPFMRLTPSAVKLGVVVSGIVGNDDHAAPALVSTALDQAQESPDRHRIKTVGFAREEELAVPKAHRAEIAHALSGGVVQQHGVFDFGRHPHAAARAVLLEAHLI